MFPSGFLTAMPSNQGKFYAISSQGFPGGSVVQNLFANAGAIGDVGFIPGWKDPLEKEMATHSRVLVWEILWTEDSGQLHTVCEVSKSQT